MIVQRTVHQSWALAGGVIVVLLLALLGFLFLTDGGVLRNFGGNSDESGAVLTGGTSSSSQSSASSTRNVPFSTAAKGQQGGSSDRGLRAVSDQNGLTVLLATMEDPTSIAADFDSTMVIAAFAGEKLTGGHDIEITSITEQQGMVTVEVVETSPAAGCAVTQTITTPYHIVLVRQPHADVRFHTTQRVQECP